MGIRCVDCEFVVSGGIDEFRKHIAQRNHKEPYKCAEGECGDSIRTFRVRSSLIRHLKECHADSVDSTDLPLPPLPTDEPEPGSCSESSEESESVQYCEPQSTAFMDVPSQPEPRENFQKNIEKSVALMILRLRKRGNVTGTAISAMIEECQQLVSELVISTKDAICLNLKENLNISDHDIEKCVSCVDVGDPFSRLKTKEQQMAFFEKNFNLVQPISKFLRTRYDQRMDPSTSHLHEEEVVCSFQYIPVINTLTAVLNNPVLFKQIHEEKKSTDGILRSYLDGTAVEKNELVNRYPHTLRLVPFADEFECVNPLSSKTSVHKIMGVYFQIQNLPPEENSRLRSIHVAAYGYSEDLEPPRGIDSLLEPFYDDLEELECEEGVVVEVNGQPYTLRATLMPFAADGLGASQLLGLSSSSSDKFCRMCLISRKDLHANILFRGEQRTKDLHSQHVAEVRRLGPPAKKMYGVERESMTVKRYKYIDFPDIVAFDGFHDFLRGIAQMELKLALHEFCFKKKYFNVVELNALIQSFDYGSLDQKNKPSPNFTELSLRNLSSYVVHQTGAQTWCLLRALPFIVGHKVSSKNDNHMKLIVLLKRITDIVFSAAVSEADIELLNQLIYDHHTLFFTLYPPEETLPSDDEEISDSDESEPQTEAAANPEKEAPGRKRKKIRPINKHHNALYYSSMIQKFGPAVLYWCMRFEGKHAIAKRMATICCNFKNLPLTLAHIHQISQCAALLELKQSVKDELLLSLDCYVSAGKSGHFEVLSTVGLSSEDMLRKANKAKVGGFEYRNGLFVIVPVLLDSMPVFGCISAIYVRCSDSALLFVLVNMETEEYDNDFAAFRVKKTQDPTFRAVIQADISSHRPMCSWTVQNSSAMYLSPRCTLADLLFDPAYTL